MQPALQRVLAILWKLLLASSVAITAIAIGVGLADLTKSPPQARPASVEKPVVIQPVWRETWARSEVDFYEKRGALWDYVVQENDDIIGSVNGKCTVGMWSQTRKNYLGDIVFPPNSFLLAPDWMRPGDKIRYVSSPINSVYSGGLCDRLAMQVLRKTTP